MKIGKYEPNMDFTRKSGNHSTGKMGVFYNWWFRMENPILNGYLQEPPFQETSTMVSCLTSSIKVKYEVREKINFEIPAGNSGAAR